MNEIFTKTASLWHMAVEFSAPLQDGIHKTKDGREIPLAELTGSHLLNILRAAHMGARRHQYVDEARRRGLINRAAICEYCGEQQLLNESPTLHYEHFQLEKAFEVMQTARAAMVQI